MPDGMNACRAKDLVDDKAGDDIVIDAKDFYKALSVGI